MLRTGGSSAAYGRISLTGTAILRWATIGVPVHLHTGAKSWRPVPPAPVFQIIVLVSFCREQSFGMVVLLPVQVSKSVTPKEVIAWLHSC